MTPRLLLALILIGCAGARVGAASPAEDLLRAGKPAEALRALRDAGSSSLTPEEASYWEGRALVQLERPEEALACFRRVPEGHALYPYAARGVLYCAWQSPELDFEDEIEPLLNSSDPAIANLALMARAEYVLRYRGTAGSAAYTELLNRAKGEPDILPIVKLLSVHTKRIEKDYAGGIELVRQLEHDATLSPLMRQRLRLDLAELYYDKEKQPEAPNAQHTAAEDEEDEGKGEETLLQFITANPDSPLLLEAFRRLYEQGALRSSEYALQRLNEWAEDTMHPRRAAIALFLLREHEETRGGDGSAYVNRAASDLPGEPVTREMMHEHIRKLYHQGKDDEARLYLSLLETMLKDRSRPRTLFFRARSLWHADPAHAAQLFLQAAESAESSLRTASLVNALICALRSEDERLALKILNEQQSESATRALLLAHAEYILEQRPEEARKELEKVSAMEPTDTQRVNIKLDTALLDIPHAPKATLALLLSAGKSERAAYSHEQQLRYAALVEKAADALSGSESSAEDLLMQIYEESDSLPVKESLALHLADRLSRAKKHQSALSLLRDLIKRLPTGETKAAALLYAGQESARLGTFPALGQALELFEESARQGASLTYRAMIEQAGLLVRMNRTADAFALLHTLRQRHAALSADEHALMLTVQADAYGLNNIAEALRSCRQILAIPHVNRAWKVRAYLQHAAFCARSGQNDQALNDYRLVMENEREAQRSQERPARFFFYYAGAGAIYQLLQLERYSEAAAEAEQIAAYAGEEDQQYADVFHKWAQSIRQDHYLPGSVINTPDTGD